MKRGAQVSIIGDTAYGFRLCASRSAGMTPSDLTGAYNCDLRLRYFKSLKYLATGQRT